MAIRSRLRSNLLAALQSNVAHFDNPLRAAIGSVSAWCGPLGSSSAPEVQSVVPSASQRCISTSEALHQRRGFQSVLKKPFSKSLMLTKDNFMTWRNSRFDVQVGEKLLQESYLARYQKQENTETRRLQAQLIKLIKTCSTVSDLAMVVRKTAPHMGPDAVVAAICRSTRLPLTINDADIGTVSQRLVPELLDLLLPVLDGHCDALNTGQLAAVMAAIARVGYRPSASSHALLMAEVSGDVGLQRVDAAGPSETAALMLACSRLSWGSTELWERMGEAALAQLEDMEPKDIARALQAACWAPGASRQGPTLGRGTVLWVHAEQVVCKRMAEFSHPELAKVLISFSASNAVAGMQLRSAADARLSAGEWPAVPPAALVDFARASGQMMRTRGTGVEASVSSMMQQACSAATHVVTHMDSRLLEQLLSAVLAAYPGGAETAAGPAVQAPRVVSQLLKLVASVLHVRGLGRSQAGAVPAPVRVLASSARSVPSGDPSNCDVLLLLAKLGYFQNGDPEVARLKKEAVGLLASLLPSSLELLGQGALGPNAAASLLEAYSLAGEAAPLDSVAKLAEHAAVLLEAGAFQLPTKPAAMVLLAMARGRPNDKVVRTMRALSDRLVGSDDLAKRLSAVEMRDLKAAMMREGSGLEGHVLVGKLRGGYSGSVLGGGCKAGWPNQADVRMS